MFKSKETAALANALAKLCLLLLAFIIVAFFAVKVVDSFKENMMLLKESSQQPLLPAENKAEVAVLKDDLLLQNSPIFKKALAKTPYDQILDQIDKLGRENIKISLIWSTANNKDILEFLIKLQSCEECKKTFAFFGSNDIYIGLCHRNEVRSKRVSIDVGKNPEEIAEWLATGKEK